MRKRIDEFSQVIKHNGTVYDLMALEQAYAPPFSSAKDPVAVAGYVAGNILSGKMKPLYWRELQCCRRCISCFIFLMTSAYSLSL